MPLNFELHLGQREWEEEEANDEIIHRIAYDVPLFAQVVTHSCDRHHEKYVKQPGERNQRRARWRNAQA